MPMSGHGVTSKDFTLLINDYSVWLVHLRPFGCDHEPNSVPEH